MILVGRIKGSIIPLMLFLVVLGCAAKAEKTLVTPGRLLVEDSPPPFADDLDVESLSISLGRSLAYYDRLPENTLLNFGDRQISARLLKESLLAFQKILRLKASPEILGERIRESFDTYRADLSAGSILLTGYYEPLLTGSPVKTEKYRYPIYRVPDDLVIRGEPEKTVSGRWYGGTLIPYYSRAEIEGKHLLEGRNLEIAWVDDPVELYSLHVQGSGRIVFPDGAAIRVGYARSNGRPFRSITRCLLSRGRITEQETSYEAVKKYLKAQPEEELFSILHYNESYVFFQIVPVGPRGSLGVPLTEGRSIAVDPEMYPKGAIAFLISRKPVFGDEKGGVAWTPFSRFVLSQDAGVAIKGPGRVDLFCGSGGEAERIAGSLKEPCDLYILIKKQ